RRGARTWVKASSAGVRCGCRCAVSVRGVGADERRHSRARCGRSARAASACYEGAVSEANDEPTGWRPRWWPLIVVVFAGTLLPSLGSETVRALAPLLLLYVSRDWLGRITRTLMAVGSAAHASLLIMLLWPTP